jgi:hypothetical protein
MGCTADKPSPPPQKAESLTPEPSDVLQDHRFVPTGADPEIALDTLNGSLCRTIDPTTGSTDKYAKLPMCGVEPATSPATPVKFAWSEALKGAPLTASCYRAKSLVDSDTAQAILDRAQRLRQIKEPMGKQSNQLPCIRAIGGRYPEISVQLCSENQGIDVSNAAVRL